MLLDILLVLMFAVANIIVLWAGLRIIYVVVFTPWEVNNACQHSEWWL